MPPTKHLTFRQLREWRGQGRKMQEATLSQVYGDQKTGRIVYLVIDHPLGKNRPFVEVL